ncbi:efflux transporter outer membrane subunit [Candidatus Magnetaquicoccus inordinatus]|uniref:efflux transporter outer membrane subunit n=1 Tax=Candidatus Magnetaquicoccus inordinatus TaxID=2496818 RepID=UPI001D0F2C2F|nr:efflux transporter outer membrane subunit [Candidatus Magnetaquicoccus inordinatus]
MRSIYVPQQIFLLFLLTALLSLGGCSLSLPKWPSELLQPHSKQWQARLPHDGSNALLLDWWKQFDDPLLPLLIESAHASHPNLQRAVAAIKEARATTQQRQSDLLPRLDGSISSQRVGDRSDTKPGTANTALPEALNTNSGLDAKWELDLFGGLQHAKTAAEARLHGRQHAWHDARITLAAEVAGKYLQYRACQQLLQLNHQEAESRQVSAQLTTIAVNAGLQAAVDRYQAEARLQDAHAAVHAQEALCTQTVKSLVTLSGLDETTLRQLLADPAEHLPQPAAFEVRSLPADLLTQRPDLAVLEQEVIAAMADREQAAANRLPRLTLSGTIALNTIQTAHTVIATQPWSLGPLLTLPLLDGGGREARVAEAEARYEQAVARYQTAIQSAVEEVEIALVTLDSARLRLQAAQASRQQQQSVWTAQSQLHQQGGISRLTMEEFQRALLAAQRAELLLQRERVQAWITLYKSLGGGWQAEHTPSSPSSPSNQRDEP